jgi:LysM repeat protein
MKHILIWLLLSMSFVASAQKQHTVAAKESFYSIGRLYNVHPRDLATFNNIDFDKGLSIGQVIKIPPASKAAPMPDVPAQTNTPLPVTKELPKKKTANATSAVYHTVAPKEGLYGISKKYNVTIDEIKKWNNLNSDALTIGMNIIVGYSEDAAPVAVKPVPQKAPEPQNVPEVYSDPKPSVTVVTPSVPKDEVPVKNNNTGFNGGFFKSYYTQQAAAVASNNDNGMAGIFKSMSGWDDGKYYCLHNAAPAGSFIKITNKATNKVIYAKVLDLMPNLSQNKLLIIQVSSAAAAELGVTGASFDSEIAY